MATRETDGARWERHEKNTNVFGKLFSFDRVSDDPIDIKLVKIKLAMTIVESFFNDFVI